MSKPHVVTPGRDMRARAANAVADAELQRAMRNLDGRLDNPRYVERHHRDLKDRAAVIRRETLADLDGWLSRLESRLNELGVRVHRAATPEDARRSVIGIATASGAKRIAKGKSMATEEIGLNEALEEAGLEVVETDLGEYIIQVAGERPSHMIAPAIHKTLPQVRALLSAEAGRELPSTREDLTEWVRGHLRGAFLSADLGITGANFAAADTGTIVLVTNEGNGRFCTTWPRVHVVVMAVDKVIPRFADLAVLLPLLTMSATGQPLSNYLTMLTGPRRAGELDGPEELHLVLLDHNRRRLLGSPYEEMLACVRCGACLNVCPVYRVASGHAYDAVYTGPLGALLTPLLSAAEEGCDLPFASTLCGACSEACPVEIPLADLLVRLRADLRERRPFAPAPAGSSATAPLPARPTARRGLRRLAFRSWARLWSSPRAYRASTGLLRLGSRTLRRRGRGERGAEGGGAWARRAPVGDWTRTRDLPLPAAEAFRTRWARRAETGRW